MNTIHGEFGLTRRNFMSEEMVPWERLIKRYEKKLLAIKVFLVDVDGILTDGHVYYDGEDIGFNRRFHVLDGYAFKFLRMAGIKVGVVSGGKSLGLEKRMADLKPEFLYLGNEDKRSAYLEILAKTGLKDENMLYIGDDLFDIPILKRVGFSATVPHASPDVKIHVDYVTQRDGGSGSMREVADLVRLAQKHPYFFEDF